MTDARDTIIKGLTRELDNLIQAAFYEGHEPEKGSTCMICSVLAEFVIVADSDEALAIKVAELNGEPDRSKMN
jgi:hypothetical protein